MRSVGFLSSYIREFREALVWPHGKSSLYSGYELESGTALESRQGNQASRRFEGGISRSFGIGPGNPGFLRLMMVNSASFSGCLWEVRTTVELGEASRHFTGFGAMEEGLILD